ncbi:putative ribosomal RNA small subunit methyltransferase B [Rhodospirillaceae bacterium LM-1]|nr:putative ribosomal RNA small subunit methyltransferase B [Rhodospirillaceae bacterium LM-1]
MSAQGLVSRQAALELIRAVLSHRKPLDTALDASPAFKLLPTRDRGLARHLAATTLRRLNAIDDLIGQCIDKPLGERGEPGTMALRLGVAQLLFLELPPHAAVATAVDLAPANYKGLVNAVLRRIGRDGKAMLNALELDRICIPDWLWRDWVQDWGEERAGQIAKASLQEAPLDLCVIADAAKWAETLSAETLPTGSLRLMKPGSVTELPGFKEGAWWVQDAAAALPARLLGDVKGMKVADLCAAPGGKTVQLAALGAEVTAVEKVDGKMPRLRENLARLHLQARLITADATSWRPVQPQDAILLDAPCTATGTIRRHPDALHLKRQTDVAGMREHQARMLENAAKMLKPGGKLVYCVCSLSKAEGESIAQNAPPSLAPDPIAAHEIPGLPNGAITPEGYLRTFPDMWADKGGMDGFFAARFTRIEG